MRYEIDENNGFAIKIFHDGQTEPVIFQPEWPDGTTWASKKEAETWAKIKIDEFDPNFTIMAGGSPSEPTRPRPTKEQEIAGALGYLGITLDDLKTVLGL